MMPHGATDGGPRHSMVARHVTSDATHCGTLDAPMRTRHPRQRANTHREDHHHQNGPHVEFLKQPEFPKPM
jgi:hypothetical protein